MKKNSIISTVGAVFLGSLVGMNSLFAQGAPVTPAVTPTPAAPKLTKAEVKEVISYFFGYQMSERLASSGLNSSDINMEQIIKGVNAGIKGEKPVHSGEKIQAALKVLQLEVQARLAKIAQANLKAGKAFLAENGKRKGVTITTSGLQYEIIKAGSGKKYAVPVGGIAADKGTKFVVNYRGTLIDGTEFDKSPEGKTFTMTLNNSIAGFKEALTTMPIGAKWKLFIPSELAYGNNPSGPKIQANSTLVFELELVEIKVTPKTPARPSAVTPPIRVPFNK